MKEQLIKLGFEESWDKILGIYRYEGWVMSSKTQDWFHLVIDDFASNMRDRLWSVHIDNDHFETVGYGCFSNTIELTEILRALVGAPLVVFKNAKV